MLERDIIFFIFHLMSEYNEPKGVSLMVTYFVAREGNLNYKDSLSVYIE